MALTGEQVRISRPPAKEIISGLAATLRISRINGRLDLLEALGKTAA